MGLLPAILSEVQRLRLSLGVVAGTNPVFGSGANLDVTLSANDTLDAPYLAYNKLTIEAGVVIDATATPMYIVVKDTLTVEGSLTVSGKGGAGGASNSGDPGSDGTFYAWTPAVAGSVLRSGPGGAGANKAFPVLGDFSPDTGLIKGASALLGQSFFMEGPGGGAGGLGFGGSGSGGNGGGVLYIFAKTISVPLGGIISANGIDGVDGGTSGGFQAGASGGAGGGGSFIVGGGGGGHGFRHGGGGGGGAGGCIILLYENLDVAGSIEANGGAGGDGTGGSAGYEGGAGGTANSTQPGIFNITDPTGGNIVAAGTDAGGGGAGGDSGVILSIPVGV